MQPPSLIEKFPVELIYEIQLFALNSSIPIVSKRAHEIFKSTHPSYRAEYIYLRYITGIPQSLTYTKGQLVSYALTFPLCTEEVLDALFRLVASERSEPGQGPRPFLPKRLFKHLGPRTPPAKYVPSDAPVPFLQYLYANTRVHPPDPNAHDGYALARAVHAGHTALVRFLLRRGAKPSLKDALALRIAIKKRDLGLVTMLVEREAEEEYEDYYLPRSEKVHSRRGSESFDTCGRGQRELEAEAEAEAEAETRKRRRKNAKRRRVEDRVEVTTAMLLLAVETDARDIVQYFLDKGARPDLLTIQRMRRTGFV